MGPERACALALVLLVGAGVPAVAQQTPTAADIEAQVARSQGYERARALADLVWRLRNDNPRRAIEAAHEALGLFALHPDPEDEGAIAQAIRDLDERADLREHIVQAGLRRVSDFSWQRCADQTLEVYREALAEG